MTGSPVLTVEGLRTALALPGGTVHVVDGISFTVGAGETVGLVGESGCGKSMTALSIMGLLPQPVGRIVEGGDRSRSTPIVRLDRQPRGARGGLTVAQAWYAVAILTVANVSGFIDRQILSLLVGPMKRDLHVTDTQVSLLMGMAFVVFYSLLGLPIGRLVDRGKRPMIVAIGAALWSVFTMTTGLARSFLHLFVARIGVGVGEATLGPAAVSIIGDAFPRRRLGTAMSVYMSGTFFGSGLAYALGAWIVGTIDSPEMWVLPLVGDVRPWQTVFFLIGLPGMLIAGLLLTMREPARQHPVGDAPASAPLSEVFAYMRANARTVLALSLGFACSASVNYGMGAWLATFFVRTHNWTIQQAGTLQGALTMTFGVLGAIAGGRLTDYWSAKGHGDAPLRVGIAGATGMLVCAGLYPIVPSATLAAALLVPVNIFAALPWGAANAAIAEAMPSRMRGQGSALYQLIVNLFAGALGPTAVALLTDHVFGDEMALRWSLSICAVVGMTLAIVLLSVARPAYRTTVGVLEVQERPRARSAATPTSLLLLPSGEISN